MSAEGRQSGASIMYYIESADSSLSKNSIDGTGLGKEKKGVFC